MALSSALAYITAQQLANMLFDCLLPGDIANCISKKPRIGQVYVLV